MKVICSFSTNTVLFIFLMSMTACSPVDEQPYFPSRSGLTWIYQIYTNNWRHEPAHHKLVINSLAQKTIDNKKVFLRQRHDSTVSFFTESEKGIALIHTGSSAKDLPGPDPDETLVLGYPLKQGTRWSKSVKTFLIPEFACGYCTTTTPLKHPVEVTYEIVDTSANLEIPAGRFENCIHVVGKGSKVVDAGKAMGFVRIDLKIEEWYAPGVGLIKFDWLELPEDEILETGEYRMALAKFEAR